VENEVKELEPMKVYKYLGVAENHNIEHKNEKEKLKKESKIDFEHRAECRK
jgi:hypothetical protein